MDDFQPNDRGSNNDGGSTEEPHVIIVFGHLGAVDEDHWTQAPDGHSDRRPNGR